MYTDIICYAVDWKEKKLLWDLRRKRKRRDLERESSFVKMASKRETEKVRESREKLVSLKS
jgi:hypothetical protein